MVALFFSQAPEQGWEKKNTRTITITTTTTPTPTLQHNNLNTTTKPPQQHDNNNNNETATTPTTATTTPERGGSQNEGPPRVVVVLTRCGCAPFERGHAAEVCVGQGFSQHGRTGWIFPTWEDLPGARGRGTLTPVEAARKRPLRSPPGAGRKGRGAFPCAFACSCLLWLCLACLFSARGFQIKSKQTHTKSKQKQATASNIKQQPAQASQSQQKQVRQAKASHSGSKRKQAEAGGRKRRRVEARGSWESSGSTRKPVEASGLVRKRRAGRGHERCLHRVLPW